VADRLSIPGFLVEPAVDDLDGVVDDMTPLAVPLPKADRIWVIGNGPGLRAEDLTALHERGEICVGMNRIHLVYDRTPWRPHAYFLGDTRGNMAWAQDVLFHAAQGYRCFIKNLILGGMTPYCDHATGSWTDEAWAENVVPLAECRHDYLDLRPPRRWHAPYLCCFAGSMNVALQAAVLSKRKHVILLGVDHSWQVRDRAGTADPNHFDPRYDGGLEHGELNGQSISHSQAFVVVSERAIEKNEAEAVYLHRLAAREAAARGVLIINASRETRLSTYPRADFEELVHDDAV
jgi:hypothetical protein